MKFFIKLHYINYIIPLLIHLYQDMTDELDLRTMANEFIALNENRKRVFSVLVIILKNLLIAQLQNSFDNENSWS